jgi:hypothetical protein
VAGHRDDVQSDYHVFCNALRYETFGSAVNNGILSEHAGNSAFKYELSTGTEALIFLKFILL